MIADLACGDVVDVTYTTTRVARGLVGYVSPDARLLLIFATRAAGRRTDVVGVRWCDESRAYVDLLDGADVLVTRAVWARVACA